jgi:hypothetical protein
VHRILLEKFKKLTQKVKKHSTIIVTSFFYKNIKYLNTFIESLNNQTDQEFDLLLSIDRFNYKNYLKKIFTKKKIFIIKEKNEIIKTKNKLIKLALKKNYKYIIFADSDDTFSANRVEVSKNLLKKKNIIVNNVKYFGNHKSTFSNWLNNNSGLSNKMLLNGNILGFSNTAVKSEILKDRNLNFMLSIDALKVYNIDWLFFLYILLKEKKIIFNNDVSTYWRSDSSRLSSFKKYLTKSNFFIFLESQIKIFKITSRYSIIYQKRYKKLLRVKNSCKNSLFLKKLLKKNNFLLKFKCYKWWYLPTLKC